MNPNNNIQQIDPPHLHLLEITLESTEFELYGN